MCGRASVRFHKHWAVCWPKGVDRLHWRAASGAKNTSHPQTIRCATDKRIISMIFYTESWSESRFYPVKCWIFICCFSASCLLLLREVTSSSQPKCVSSIKILVITAHGGHCSSHTSCISSEVLYKRSGLYIYTHTNIHTINNSGHSISPRPAPCYTFQSSELNINTALPCHNKPVAW